MSVTTSSVVVSDEGDVENPLLSAQQEETKEEALGLTNSEVASRLEKFGRNEVPIEKASMFEVFIRQYYGTMPSMLILACVLAAAVQDWQDFGIILAMLFINGCIGFYEESKALSSLEALKGELRQHVSVLRDGEVVSVDVAELVPGDVVALRGGQAVPADGEWIDGDAVKVDTAALTGEPIPRTVGGNSPKALLAGCVITQGECQFIVRATGAKTEVGQATEMVADAKKGPKPIGRFEAQILVIVKLIIIASLAITLIVLAYQIHNRHETFSHVLLVCLSLVIGAVPIALPLVLQVTMALGAREMAEHGAIVTHTTALQEIASMTILNSDKTGTLTTAKMAVIPDMIWLAKDDDIIIPENEQVSGDNEKPLTKDDCLVLAALASNANNLEDPIDTAILTAARTHFGEAGLAQRIAAYGNKTNFDGFNPEVKRAVAVFEQQGSDGEEKNESITTIIAKGLLDKILDTGNDSGAQQWTCVGVQRDSRLSDEAIASRVSSENEEQEASAVSSSHNNDELGQQSTARELEAARVNCRRLGGGVRARALAADAVLSSAGYKTIAVAVMTKKQNEKEERMRLIGLVPMIDPPRLDTAATLFCLQRAGISVKMITGDHQNIARETARLIGLGDNILPQTELWPASATRDELIMQADGFAQTMPRDKREVVLVLQQRGLVVGMTGDGVNDCAALAAAQVGIAVEGATDAAQNAADIVLTRPGLSAIYAACFESRLIFRRLRAYVLYRVAATIQIVLVLCFLIFIWNDELKPLYVVLLALLNDISMTPVAHDRVSPSPDPELGDTSQLLIGALALGILQAMFSLGFYIEGERITAIDGFHGSHNLAIRQAAVYVQISLSVELLIFNCRAPKPLIFTKAPSLSLFTSVMLGNLIVCAMAKFAILVAKPLSWRALAGIIIYDTAAFFALDIIKIALLWATNSLEPSDRKLAEPEEIPRLVKAADTARDKSRRSSLFDAQRSSVIEHRFSERLSTISRLSHGRDLHVRRSSILSAGGGDRSSFRSSLRPNVPANMINLLHQQHNYRQSE